MGPEIGQGVYDSDGNVETLEGIIIDISDRKRGAQAEVHK